MRIIGGSLRGLKLTPVGDGDAAAHLRPTSDRVREAIFNLLINGGYGDPVHDAQVLDLFAGTGALGLEALSRGAAHAVFVDNGNAARALQHHNFALTRTLDRVEALRRDATKLGLNKGASEASCFWTRPMARVWARRPWPRRSWVDGWPPARWWSGRRRAPCCRPMASP